MPDDHGRSECGNCGWFRLRVGDMPSLYSLFKSLVGTWSGHKPACDRALADKTRAALEAA